MSEIIQVDPSEASTVAQNVVELGPSLESRRKLHYFNSMPKDTAEFDGTMNTMTVSEWLQHIEYKFDSVGVPYSYRTGFAGSDGSRN